MLQQINLMHEKKTKCQLLKEMWWYGIRKIGNINKFLNQTK